MFEKFSWWFVNDCKHEIKYPWSVNTNKKNAIIFKTIQSKTRHDRLKWSGWTIKILLHFQILKSNQHKW